MDMNQMLQETGAVEAISRGVGVDQTTAKSRCKRTYAIHFVRL